MLENYGGIAALTSPTPESVSSRPNAEFCAEGLYASCRVLQTRDKLPRPAAYHAALDTRLPVRVQLLAGATDRFTELRECVTAGRRHQLKRLLADHPELADSRDELGQPVLTLAASLGRVDIVAVLLDHGADLHARDSPGTSSEVPDTPSGPGKTALLVAAEHGRVGAVELLLSRGAGVDDTGGPEAMAPQAVSPCSATVWTHIRAGRGGRWHDHGWSALMHAASQNDGELCAALLKFGASTSLRSRWGLSAADLAIDAGVKEMLASGRQRVRLGLLCVNRTAARLRLCVDGGCRERLAAAILVAAER